MLADVLLAAADVVRSEGLEQGYRLVVNTGPGRRPDRLPRARARARRQGHDVADGVSAP